MVVRTFDAPAEKLRSLGVREVRQRLPIVGRIVAHHGFGEVVHERQLQHPIGIKTEFRRTDRGDPGEERGAPTVVGDRLCVT